MVKPSKVTIKPSETKAKKYVATIEYPDGTVKRVSFGAKGYSDYTIHRDTERRDRYDSRHNKNENWTLSGVNTAGFWAKWLLWNKPTIGGSAKDISSRFGFKVVIGR
jgi:hypothetical protein